MSGLSQPRSSLMAVKVKFLPPFRTLFGGRERELSADGVPTIGELLDRLADTPERRAALFAGTHFSPHLVVLINGSPVAPSSFVEAPVHDGDTVAVFPLLGGG